MRSLLHFTLMTATCLAFEKPVAESAVKENKSSLPELDYNQLQPVQPQAQPSEMAAPGQIEQSPRPTSAAHSDQPWLGVLGDTLSAPMQAQFGTKHGLVLKYVVPGSPADRAGLKMYDIILDINGVPISDQSSLKKVIAERTSRCKVNLTVLSQGERRSCTLQLCDRPEDQKAPPARAAEGGNRQLSELQRLMEEGLQLNEQPPAPQERSERSGFGRFFGKLLKDMVPNLDLNFESSGSVRVHDNSGSVEIHTINGAKSVIVRGANNEVQFEGPWDTEEDYAKAPAEIKQRIDNVGTNFRNFGNSQIKSDIR